MQNGFFLSFIAVTLWALNGVVKRFLAMHWHIDPTVFTCASLFSAAFVLIVIAGPGRLGLDTVKKPQTWLYGLFEVLVGVAHMSLLMLVSSTEASFLTRLSVLFSLVAAWLFFGRKPSWMDATGSLLVAVCIFQIIFQMSYAIIPDVLLTTILCELAVTARTLCSESHPSSNNAQSIKERCRVTGYVLMVTSFCFLLLMAGPAYLKASFVGETHAGAWSFIPNGAAFEHMPSVLGGFLYGMFLLAATRYFYFYAARVATSENLLAMGVLSPFLTFGFEWVGSLNGWLDITTITPSLFLWGTLSLCGAVLMLGGRHIKARKATLRGAAQR